MAQWIVGRRRQTRSIFLYSQSGTLIGGRITGELRVVLSALKCLRSGGRHHGTRRPDEPGGGRGGPGELLSPGNTYPEPATYTAGTRPGGGELPLFNESRIYLKTRVKPRRG